MLNVAVVMGRLVADPELRHTPSDVAVTSFTLAVDRSYVKSGTERQADFIDVVAWRSTADFVCKYFRKGQMMAVHGSIQTRTYTDKDGNKCKATEIVANDVNFADSKRSDSGANYGAPSAPSYGNNYGSNSAAGNEMRARLTANPLPPIQVVTAEISRRSSGTTTCRSDDLTTTKIRRLSQWQTDRREIIAAVVARAAEKYAASALTKRITSITRMLPSFAVLFLKEARSSPEELRELVHIISVA